MSLTTREAMRSKICLIFSVSVLLNGYSQVPKIKPTESFSIISLQEKQKSIDVQINENSKNIDRVEKNTIENINSYKDSTKSLLNIYLSIILGGCALIGFAINFFGKNAIKKRIEEIISETAEQHIKTQIVSALNSRITSELIEETLQKKSEEEIARMFNNFESKGKVVLDEFKNRTDEVIKSMLALASPPFTQSDLKASDITEAQRNIAIQADELFSLAFNSTDVQLQISLYQSVLDLQPKNISALNNLSDSYNSLNQPDKAIEILNQALQIDNDYFLAYSNRSHSYYLKDEYENSLLDANKAIELNPTFYHAFVIKSMVYKKQGQFEEAEKALKAATQQDPRSAEAAYSLAFYYEETNQFHKSLEFYEKATALNFPNKAMLLNNIAVLFRRQKQFDKALEYIEKARRVNPNFPNLDGTKALIYADKNDDANFFKFLKIALERGCKVWDYLADSGFDKYRETKRLEMLIKPYKQKYFS